MAHSRFQRNAYGPFILFNGMVWVPTHPGVHFDMLGFIPTFLSSEDPRPAAQQIDSNYGHGGGWRAFPGFTLLEDGNLKYPGDPPTCMLYKTMLPSIEGKREEEFIFFYQHSWLRIAQPSGSWEVCRLD